MDFWGIVFFPQLVRTSMISLHVYSGLYERQWLVLTLISAMETIIVQIQILVYQNNICIAMNKYFVHKRSRTVSIGGSACDKIFDCYKNSRKNYLCSHEAVWPQWYQT